MMLEEHQPLLGYQLLDSGNGQRLEKYGEYLLARPDPAALWKKSLPENEWKKADALFVRLTEDKGKWRLNQPVPEKWLMSYNFGKGDSDEFKINFYAKLTPFKHTGVFPEQAANWKFIAERIIGAEGRAEDVKVLNLFGYTGIASVLAAKCGARVTHVDASKPSISWAKENMAASGLPDDAIRWIFDDVLKFVKREARRGVKYNGIILDPPAFGRGPKGEIWKFNEHLPRLLEAVEEICESGKDFKFLIINAYAVSISAMALNNLLQDFSIFEEMGSDRRVDYGELMLHEKSGRQLSTGIFARLYNQNIA